MKFKHFSHRHAFYLLENEDDYKNEWASIKRALNSITDIKLVQHFKANHKNSKSISATINDLIKTELENDEWHSESPIFQDSNYDNKRWSLDFAKNKIAIEVAFNHGEAVSWNLIKPNLSGELNHVKKALQTDIGIVITATDEMKAAGGFDSAVGTYEKYLRYLKPLSQMLTVPMLIIGLEAPKSFHIVHSRIGNRNIGKVKTKSN